MSCACNRGGAAACGFVSAGGGPVLQRVHPEESAEEPRRRVRPDCRGGEQVGRDAQWVAHSVASSSVDVYLPSLTTVAFFLQVRYTQLWEEPFRQKGI